MAETSRYVLLLRRFDWCFPSGWRKRADHRLRAVLLHELLADVVFGWRKWLGCVRIGRGKLAKVFPEGK